MEENKEVVHSITAVEDETREGYNVSVTGSSEAIMNMVSCGIEAIMETAGVDFETVVESLRNSPEVEVL